MFFELPLICGFALLTRLAFMLASESTDLDLHLWLISLRKKQGVIGMLDIRNSLVRGEHGYPSLPHWLPALFERKHWIAAGTVFNVAYDLLSVVIVYVLAHSLFRSVLPVETDWLLSPAGAAALLFATAPILHPLTARLRAIGGRTLSNALLMLYFISLGYGSLAGAPLFYVPCVALGIAVILSSQFGMQVLVAGTLAVAIGCFSFAPLLVLAATLAVAVLIPKLGAGQLLVCKLGHYRWYLANMDRGTTAAGRNRLKDLLLLPLYLVSRPREFLDVITRRSTLIVVASNVPTLVVLMYWWMAYPETLRGLIAAPPARYGLALIGGALVACVLTSKGTLRFLGQSERYIEYAAGYISIAFVMVANQLGRPVELIYVVLLAQLGAVLFNLTVLLAGSGRLAGLASRRTSKGLDPLVAFLLAQPQRMSIITIPTKFSFELELAAGRDDFRYYYDNFYEPGRGLSYMNEDCVEYQYIRPDFEHFRRRYRADTLIVRKSALASAHKQGIGYSFERLDRLYENEEYAVYDIWSTLPIGQMSAVSSSAQEPIEANQAA